MDFSTVIGVTLPNNLQVIKIEHNNVVLWQSGGGEDFSTKYFFVEDASGQANTVSITKASSSSTTPSITVEKSTDGTTWETLGTTAYGTPLTATVPANGRLYLRATCNQWGNNNSRYNKIDCSGDYNVGGNIMSLLYGSNFLNQTSLPNYTYTLTHLFDSSTTLKSAEHLVLPATTLANRCYSYMFYGCTSLTTAPELPATTLVSYCYYYMFRDCTSLTTAPELPATTLDTYCYSFMFYNCKRITTTPELPATTLANYCYYYMFYGCISLTTAPALPATTLANTCYGYMFDGCTSLTTAPELPATTLASNCYSHMFYGCSSLSYVKALFTTWSSGNTSYWLDGVAASGTLVLNGGFTGAFTTGESGLPSGWDAEYTYLSAPIITQSGNDVTITGHYLADVVYTIQPTGGSQGSPVTVMGSTTFAITQNCTIRAYETDSTGSQSSVTTYNATYTKTMAETYFFVEDITGSPNSITIQKYNAQSSAPTITVYYSTDETTWNSRTTSTTAQTITVPANGRLYLKATANRWGNSTSVYNTIKCNNNCNIGGNIMSLLYGDNFIGQSTLPSTYSFINLFNVQSTKIVSVANLVMPATTLTDYCYYRMFRDCTGLTTVPELPATTLTTYCYYGMFYGCSSLNSVKCLATDISATNCTYNWLYGVAATGTFTKAASMTGWTTGVNGIPSGWTVQNA